MSFFTILLFDVRFCIALPSLFNFYWQHLALSTFCTARLRLLAWSRSLDGDEACITRGGQSGGSFSSPPYKSEFYRLGEGAGGPITSVRRTLAKGHTYADDTKKEGGQRFYLHWRTHQAELNKHDLLTLASRRFQAPTTSYTTPRTTL